MSTSHADVNDADRLARVKLSSAIEPGDLRVTGLVSELGAVVVCCCPPGEPWRSSSGSSRDSRPTAGSVGTCRSLPPTCWWEPGASCCCASKTW